VGGEVVEGWVGFGLGSGRYGRVVGRKEGRRWVGWREEGVWGKEREELGGMGGDFEGGKQGVPELTGSRLRVKRREEVRRVDDLDG
jgi:hypothetical protein